MVRVRDVDTDTIVSTSSFGSVYKPTSGHTYRMELCCSGVEDCDTWTDGGEVTIPEYTAGTCECCDEVKPDYVTISGFSGCCDSLNGTWTFPPTPSFCGYNSNKSITIDPSPCTSGFCLTNVLSGTTYYWHPDFASVNVQVPTGAGGTVVITCSVGFAGYRVAGSCGQGASAGVDYVYHASCDSAGEATYNSNNDSVVISGNPAFSFCGGGTGGTVSLFMVPR